MYIPRLVFGYRMCCRNIACNTKQTCTLKFSSVISLQVKSLQTCRSGYVLVTYEANTDMTVCHCYLSGWFVRDHKHLSVFLSLIRIKSIFLMLLHHTKMSFGSSKIGSAIGRFHEKEAG